MQLLSPRWIRIADTLNTRFTNCLYCKIIVDTDVLLKYFLEYYSTTFSANYQPGSEVLVHLAPSSVLRLLLFIIIIIITVRMYVLQCRYDASVVLGTAYSLPRRCRWLTG